MNMTITYTNRNGEVLEFGPGSIYHYHAHALRDWSLDASIENGRVTSVERTPKALSLPVALCCKGEDGIAARNRLADVIAADTAAGEPGTIRIGSFSLSAYIVGSSKDNWWFDDGIMEATLDVLPATGAWSRETTASFVIDRTDDLRGPGSLDFPYDFPYDYAPNRAARRFDNPSAAPSPFRLVVFGPASSPYVWIGNNLHQVNVDVPPDHLLTIDSRDKSICLVDAGGGTESAFSKRLRGAKGSGTYIFEPVPAGESAVSWNNTFGFDLTVFDERNEPAWI